MGSEQSIPTPADCSHIDGRAGHNQDTPPADSSISPDDSVCSDCHPCYTSYDNVQPIGGAEVITENRLRSAQRHIRSRITSRLHSYINTSSSSPPPGIVVVNSASSVKRHTENDDLKRLQMLPDIHPIIRSLVKSQSSLFRLSQDHTSEDNVASCIDSSAVCSLAHHLQKYLNHHAVITAKRQTQLCDKINTLDSVLTTLLSDTVSRHKLFSKYASQMQLVENIQLNVSTSFELADQCYQLINEINAKLPPLQPPTSI